MKKHLITISLATLTLGAGSALAATLAELNGPLLNKDQWELNALSGVDYSKDSNRQTVVGGAGSKASYDSTQISLVPDLSYGLSGKMSLLIKEAYVIPNSMYAKHYLLPGGADSYQEAKLLFRNTLTSALTWRPSEPWEFYFGASRGYSNVSYNNGDLPEGTGTFGSQGRHTYTTTLTAQATWLSNPKAGARTAGNRADLDGLLNPLLDRGQVKTYLLINYYADYMRAHAGQTSGSGSTFRADRSYYQQFVASPYFIYGISGDLQVQAAADLTVPNASYTASRSHRVDTSLLGVRTFKYAMTKSLMLADYSPSLRLTHRASARLQWYATGSYSYQKNSERSLAVSGATARSVYGRETASIGVGADLVSKPQKEGRPLAADLDGLKRPLLEKGQYRLGASYTTGKVRDWTEGGTSDAGQNTNLYYSEFAYGLRDTLQGFASLQITPGYSVWDSPTDKSIYFPVGSCSAGLTWRPRQTFQVYAAASLTPYYEKSRSYTGAGAVSSVSKSRSLDTTATLSATWLW